MLIWTVSNSQCYLSHHLKVSLPSPHLLHLLLLTTLFPSIWFFPSFFPWDSFTVQIRIWCLKHTSFNFKHKGTELGQWWKDKRRGLLDESRGTPIIPKSQWLGSCSLCWNQDTGDLRSCPWVFRVQESNQNCNPGVKKQGFECQDQKVIASHHLQSWTSIPENFMILLACRK